MDLSNCDNGNFAYGTDKIIAALIEVHRHLGPGLLESAYEACVCQELTLRSIPFKRQLTFPVLYKGIRIDCDYRIDLVIEGRVLIELKTVEQLLPVHEAQVITYLRLAKLPVGLLVNFNVATLKNGLRRLTPNKPNPSRPSALPVQILALNEPRDSGDEWEFLNRP